MNKNVNLAILGSRGIPARYGGYESFTENLSENLVKMRANVTVFCPSDSQYKKYIYKNINLRFVLNLEKYFGGFGNMIFDIFSLIKASFLNFSIVYMLGYGAAWFCVLPRLFGKKIVINTDGLEWKRSKWPKLARSYLKLNEYIATKFANELVSDSIAIKKYFKKKYHKNSTYITNGAELSHSKNKNILKKFGLRPFEYYLVVARLEPENNFHTIIKGFSLSNSEKNLIIVSNIKHTKYFQIIKKMADVDKRIKFLGPVYDKDELNELRTNAFAYVHGHSVGGTNPSLLESMGCGNVVIAFDVPFNREVLRNSGFFFKNEINFKNVIENLEKLNKIEINKIGGRNRNTIKKYYSWDNISKKYYNFFCKILKL